VSAAATVRAIYRYPVKSMGAEALQAVDVDWYGVVGDRRFGFVQETDHSDFPWLTIRDVPAMTRYGARCGADAEKDAPTVTTPDGRQLPVTDDALATELAAAHGTPIRLVRTFRGLFDCFPLSVLSVQTVEGLGELAARELNALRFRPTILVDAPGDDFPEDAWVGRTLQLGEGEGAPRMRVDVPDRRCMVINFDHATAERDPAVLRAAAQNRDACVGVYGSVERPGVLRAGAPVTLVQRQDI
jgi:uncharacterized protein YcbX